MTSVEPPVVSLDIIICSANPTGNEKVVTYIRAASPGEQDALGRFLGELQKLSEFYVYFNDY